MLHEPYFLWSQTVFFLPNTTFQQMYAQAYIFIKNGRLKIHLPLMNAQAYIKIFSMNATAFISPFSKR